MNTINILSIDGGGVKGLIPSQILYRIEQELLIPNSKTLYSFFDVFAGSSAGSMIVGALVYKQSSGVDLVTKYMTPENILYIMPHGCTHSLCPYPSTFIDESVGTLLVTTVTLIIFVILLVEYEKNPKFTAKMSVAGMTLSMIILLVLYVIIVGVIWYFPPKYPGLQKSALISSFVGNTQLQDTPKDVFITSYDISIQKPIFFRSWDPVTAGYNVAKVIDSSSAAPDYYPAVQIISPNPLASTGAADPNSQPNSDYYIDGGVTTNNPTNVVYAYIIDKNKANVDTTKFNILSLGTGYEIDLNSTKAASPSWGMLSWFLSGNFKLFLGNEQSVDYTVQQFADARGDEYLRIDGELNSSNDIMDNTDSRNMAELIEIGDKWYTKNICKLCTFFDVPVPDKYSCLQTLA